MPTEPATMYTPIETVNTTQRVKKYNMPTYTSECQKCGEKHDYIRKMADCRDTPECCGEKTHKLITPGAVFFFRNGGVGSGSEFEAYECPVSGDIVTSPKQRREVEARHEITVVEPGMHKKPVREPTPELPEELKPELQPALDELAKTI